MLLVSDELGFELEESDEDEDDDEDEDEDESELDDEELSFLPESELAELAFSRARLRVP